jgi:hypothetical protein
LSLADPADGLALFALPSVAGFFVSFFALQLLNEAVPSRFPLQSLDSLLHVAIANDDLNTSVISAQIRSPTNPALISKKGIE